jgi:hypothetical protein
VAGFSFLKAVTGKTSLLLGQMMMTVCPKFRQEKFLYNSLIEFT